MSSPNPEHQNSRFWPFRAKFVIVEAVLKIIVQATTFARVLFFHKRLKNERAIGYLKIVLFLTTLMTTVRSHIFYDFDFCSVTSFVFSTLRHI